MSKLDLRKEIREALPVIDCDLCGGYKPTDDEVEKFVEIFKQWALELLPKKALRNDATGDAYNCAIDEIKVRIEEE